MYSYDMYPDSTNLQELIAQAESGDTEAARNGIRQFLQKHPSTLLAWKWLADVAENTRERSGAIRRAQLLAPGDPWVIEAKKHRRPPARRRHTPHHPTAPSNNTASSTTPAKTVSETEWKNENVYEQHANPVYDTPPHDSDRGVEENVAAPTEGVHGRQPRWAIWVAAALGAAGLALLATAWQLDSF